MVLSSLVFIFYFLPIVLLLYQLVPPKAKNVLLFAASLVFYAWGEPIFVLLLLFSIAFNYASGRLIERTRRKRAALAMNVIVNVGLLVYFKYTGFFVGTAANLFGFEAPALSIALPIGISFYTFKALSYTIDVYRGRVRAQRSFLLLGLYLAMFQQLTAGPIMQYADAQKQLRRRHVTGRMFLSGFSRFAAGLCKKVLISDVVGTVWTTISGYDVTGLSAGMAWLGIIAYTLQIYFDFSGYSDMAIGLGRMFGFRTKENFDYPYISRSITEFWRRWHISLGSWFRDYIYIPLGGNRAGRLRWYLNIAIVWLLTGLWHGSSWSFVLWGVFYAVLLVAEKLFLLKGLKRIGSFACVYTMFFVVMGWVLFSAGDIGSALDYISAMFRFGYLGLGEQDLVYTFTSYMWTFIAAAVIATGAPKRLYDRMIGRRFVWVKHIAAVLGIALSTAYLMDGTLSSFLYFNF